MKLYEQSTPLADIWRYMTGKITLIKKMHMEK